MGRITRRRKAVGTTPSFAVATTSAFLFALVTTILGLSLERSVPDGFRGWTLRGSLVPSIPEAPAARQDVEAPATRPALQASRKPV